jgi:hypothetical protein
VPLGEAFHEGLARLNELGAEQCCAMCAEALWWC